MKNIRLNFNLSAAFCMVVFFFISSSTFAQKETTVLSPDKFEAKSNKGKKAVILDIRTPEEIAQGHIEGTDSADFLADDFEEKLSGMDKNKKYYVYCRSGKRTVSAAEKMQEMGFRKIFVLEGGLNNWIEQGNPIVIPTK
ncbi:hypothetical protein P872_16060 [Rhodonellum psychrophilum GCM71 = DSM 17998]|uniref:Rhodanese domain-containing protein n=2 Tax=Rhodonellum TaxID=336827 RepID=U5C5A7_9BACT|nr:MULTISPECIES: rhodanese-like domain-containing protein [Rhodonellum]ERM83357.1 hypothetical protein P872_16060 [Rhodonellum psychrophilum GCM71 = DSM 17998]SDZ38395.1 Rhodanese-related sulfurtransferase [Rhodonellum ikkaensis]